MKKNKSKKEFREALKTMDIIEIYKEVLRGKYIKTFPRGFWQQPEAEQNMIKVVKYMIEEILKWDENDIKENLNHQIFKEHKLISILNIKSLYNTINLVYPNKFKPWDFNLTNNFWTDEEHIKEAVKWLIEDKLKWNEEDIKDKLSIQTFKDYKLISILNIKPLYNTINLVYPNKFKPWELKFTSNGYWTDEEHIKEAVKWLIEDKLKWGEEDIKEKYCSDILLDNGLRSLLRYRSTYDLINLAYPNKFKITNFKNYKPFKENK